MPADEIHPPPAARRDETFPRTHRLTREAEFREVLARGYRHSGPHFSIHVLANELGHSRLGMTVPRKVGTAVVRNRIRRRLREAFRRHWRDALQARPADLVVRALPGSGDAPFEAIVAAGLEAAAAWSRGGFRERRPRGRS